MTPQHSPPTRVPSPPLCLWRVPSTSAEAPGLPQWVTHQAAGGPDNVRLPRAKVFFCSEVTWPDCLHGTAVPGRAAGAHNMVLAMSQHPNVAATLAEDTTEPVWHHTHLSVGNHDTAPQAGDTASTKGQWGRTGGGSEGEQLAQNQTRTRRGLGRGGRDCPIQEPSQQ